MGYYAGTIWSNITLPKENFAEGERRFQELMDSPRFVGEVDDGRTWRQYKYGISSYEKESKTFILDDIFNTFGFEYDEHSSTGDITELRYPDTSYNAENVKAFINLLAGLVGEGDYIEWLGSEGDEDRWMFYHHDGRWSLHHGEMAVTYPSKERMLNGDEKLLFKEGE